MTVLQLLLACVLMAICITCIKSQNEVCWPDGAYGLPRSKNGCPSTDQGFLSMGTESVLLKLCSDPSSTPPHLVSNISRGYIEFPLCVKYENASCTKPQQWQPGHYCVFQTMNATSCPAGFNYTSGTNGLQLCCQNNKSVSTPITLPVDSAFYLVSLNSSSCPQVIDMNLMTENFLYSTETNITAECVNLSPTHITFCYYEKINEVSDAPVAAWAALIVLLIPIFLVIIGVASAIYFGLRRDEKKKVELGDSKPVGHKNLEFVESWEETCRESYEAAEYTYVKSTAVANMHTADVPVGVIPASVIPFDLYDDVITSRPSGDKKRVKTVGGSDSGFCNQDSAVRQEGASCLKNDPRSGSEYDDTVVELNTKRSGLLDPYDDVVIANSGGIKSQSQSNSSTTDAQHPQTHPRYYNVKLQSSSCDVVDTTEAGRQQQTGSKFNKGGETPGVSPTLCQSNPLYRVLTGDVDEDGCNDPSTVQMLLVSPIYEEPSWQRRFTSSGECPSVEIFAELPLPYEEPLTTNTTGAVATCSTVAAYDMPIPKNAASGKETYEPPPANEDELYDDIMNISRSFNVVEYKMEEQLGEGNFSTVHLGTWMSPDGPKQVAIKRLKSDAYEDVMVNFLQEAAIMGQFHHNNVVKLVGIHKDPKYGPTLLVELLINGDLKEYLKDLKDRLHQGKTNADTLCLKILNSSLQIASGMNYLSNKGFVHRDLAARNIFLDASFICKIGDFGMSRRLAESGYYKQTKKALVPMRWMAPEALAYKKYSTASDVWSYGCVLYEMWSLGEKPLSGLPIQEIFPKLMFGYRDPPPPGCTKSFYRLMIACWHANKSKRPPFDKIYLLLYSVNRGLLEWNESDRDGIDFNAFSLGRPLTNGDRVFMDLQHVYCA